ncbi:MAG TPA: DUF3426 domain-containing protein [Roseiarcus sp.]|nr:DUF3426 domain-containing protein [Roseiarcus sp.]
MFAACGNCGRQFESGGGVRFCPRCGGSAAADGFFRRRVRAAAPVLALGLALAGAMGAVGARDRLVRWVPATAPAYAAIGLPVNLRGIAIDGVGASIVETAGRRVLTVEGSMVNLRGQKAEIPDMRIALRDANAHEIYVWTARPPKAALDPREETSFRLRLASPPAAAHDVLVRFASAIEKSAPAGDKL